jgi:transposase-like protein
VARPTKFDERRAQAIIRALRMGATRKDAAEAAGIHYDTFLEWVKAGQDATRKNRFSEFSEAVTCAEALVATQHAATLEKAAGGYPVEKRTVTKTVEIRNKKTTSSDGTVVEEPVPIEVVTEKVETYEEFDWRAAESWLKRRRKDEWGDNTSVELDREIAELLAALAAAREDQAPR